MINSQASLKETLLRLSAEIADVATRVDHLHEFVDAFDAAASSDRLRMIAAGQSVDLIEQTLEALAAYVFALAGVAPACAIDAASAAAAIQLAEVAGRLHGRASPAPPTASGDVEHF